MGLMEVQERNVDDQLIKWLNEHSEVIRDMRKRGGLDWQDESIGTTDPVVSQSPCESREKYYK